MEEVELGELEAAEANIAADAPATELRPGHVNALLAAAAGDTLAPQPFA